MNNLLYITMKKPVYLLILLLCFGYSARAQKDKTAMPSDKATVQSGLIKFYSLQPAASIIRAEWRLKLSQQPALLEVQRKKLGIDSSFTKMRTDLGYEKTKTGDSLRVHLSDTTALPGITYVYYLAGSDTLRRVFTHSDTIRSIAGNRTTVNGITKLDARAAADSSGIQLSWNPQDVHAIRSIRVFRSPYYDSAYVQLAVLPATDTSWTDRSAAIGANYYYQLAAQGDGDFSFPSPRVFGSFVSNVPMMPPSAVRAVLADSGATLSWRYHSYMNLMGFRVYRALGHHGKFEAISDVVPAHRDSLVFSFTDQDKSLPSGQFYNYAIAAISRSFKESPLSAPASLNIRKKAGLEAPLMVRSMQLSDSTISITWQDMAATDPRVEGYHVYRKPVGADSVKGFERITREPISDANELIDIPGVGKTWQYVVQSVNRVDTSAYSAAVVIKLYGDKPLPPGRVRLFAQSNSVLINWDGTLIPGIHRYHIYRASEGAAAVRITSLAYDRAASNYEDKNVKPGQLYFYYVTTETKDQVESDRSEEVGIRLKK